MKQRINFRHWLSSYVGAFMRVMPLVSTFINILACSSTLQFKGGCSPHAVLHVWHYYHMVSRGWRHGLVSSVVFTRRRIHLHTGEIHRKTQYRNAGKCVFLWQSRPLQSAMGGRISGLAVVSKTCFGSPPRPLWIKCKCSAGDVMQTHVE